MTDATESGASTRALTAADLMTPDPIRIDQSASVARAVALLDDHAVSGLAVVDEGGRPVGVLTRADIAHHYRRPHVHPSPHAGFYERVQLDLPGATGDAWKPDDEEVESYGTQTPVAELMTAEVYGVTPEAPIELVIRTMRAHRVHRLFVIDGHGVLRGVVSALDVLGAFDPWAGTDEDEAEVSP